MVLSAIQASFGAGQIPQNQSLRIRIRSPVLVLVPRESRQQQSKSLIYQIPAGDKDKECRELMFSRDDNDRLRQRLHRVEQKLQDVLEREEQLQRGLTYAQSLASLNGHISTSAWKFNPGNPKLCCITTSPAPELPLPSLEVSQRGLKAACSLVLRFFEHRLTSHLISSL